MKVLILLFNLYLLVLPCLPCGDVDNCADKSQTSVSLQKEHNPTEENKEDNCTPFCQCDCCTTAYCFQINSKEKTHVKPFTLQKFALLNDVVATNTINTIWQPPKFLA